MQQLLEVGQAGVRAREDRNLFERALELSDPRDDRRAFVGLRDERLHDRLRPVRPHRAEHLLRAAELRHQPVRDREHLRRRAVVLLEPHDDRVREARRHRQQVLRAGTRERVDRLIVVADDAELVAAAEPEIEQRLLEQVDVLVLVDGEGAPAVVNRRPHAVVPFEQPRRPLEQVLEVEQSLGGLAPLVLPEHPEREVGRDRRLVVTEPVVVRVGCEASVLRPLDLRREVAGGPEAERPRQRIADPPEERRLRREYPPRIPVEVPEQRERRRVEGRGAHPVRTECAQPRA